MLLPGPPLELKPLFLDVCVPRLRAILPERHLATRILKMAMIGESAADSRVARPRPPANPLATHRLSTGKLARGIALPFGHKTDAAKIVRSRVVERRHDGDTHLGAGA